MFILNRSLGILPVCLSVCSLLVKKDKWSCYEKKLMLLERRFGDVHLGSVTSSSEVCGEKVDVLMSLRPYRR